jgi:hypothetical protein
MIANYENRKHLKHLKHIGGNRYSFNGSDALIKTVELFWQRDCLDALRDAETLVELLKIKMSRRSNKFNNQTTGE